MNVEDSVLKKIVPSEEDVKHIDGIAERLTRKVREYMDANGIVADLKLVGSYSKGTYLSDPDLDLFVMFPMGTPKEVLVTVGLKIGQDVLHGEKMYAEHPYTSAVFEGVDVDLVPNVHIDSTDHLVTAVDRTPFHTEYVLSRLKPGQNNEIRLLKKFMKGIGTYGAEPTARGFSGYLCELLVIKYGTFRGVLEAAAGKWREGTEIVLEKKDRKLESALVFYDPVDGKRNVASAVHIDTLSRFVLAAGDYLAEPSEKFFFPRRREPLSDERVKEETSGNGFVMIQVSFAVPDVIPDNLYAQVWKTYYAIKAKLDRFGFVAMKGDFTVTDGKMHFGFLLESQSLSPRHLHAGPPVWAKNASGFLDRWSGDPEAKPTVENGKWTVIAPRQYTNPVSMLLGEIRMAGAGKDVAVDTMEILTNGDALKMDRGLVTKLLNPAMPWKV